MPWFVLDLPVGEAKPGEACCGVFLEAQPGGCGERAEEEFRLVVGEAEGVLVEDPAQGTDAGLTRVGVEGLAQGVGVDDVGGW